MTKYLQTTILLILALITIQGLRGQDRMPGELLIQLDPAVSTEVFERIWKAQHPEGPSLKHVTQLSARLGIHHYAFDERQFDADSVLSLVKGHPMTSLAQFNHQVTLRGTQATVPNDPNFGQQWSLLNTGQSGGLAGADIDATLAWDLNTGGLGALGDTLVAGVVDGGIDLSHPDLKLWKNHQEIPGNGLDDDQNGFIDDYHGWNAYNSTGNVPNDFHGSHVSGIAAARGDNQNGIAGVSWDLPVLPVAGQSSTEATVVAAYDYLLTQRIRYNQSSGQEGALIVVINSSFGVNFGDPANFPIWCGMYDSLGQAGILNVAATTNSATNVDQAGDIPTACPSDFLISVTNTTNQDQLNASTGFGPINIDLGAPGTAILSTAPGGGTALSTGTSMAAPHVSGVVGLMYAHACPAFWALHKSDPAASALILRDLLLQGAEPVFDLQGKVATGGRLNAYQALLELEDWCANQAPACSPPYNPNVSSISDSSAILSWLSLAPGTNFVVRFRTGGQSSWSLLPTNQDTLTLDTLSLCQGYEFEVAQLCGADTSAWSARFSFTTEGCCQPPDMVSANTTDTSAVLTWNPVFGASGYMVAYRPEFGFAWDSIPSTSNTATIPGLLPCSRYEFRIRSMCPNLAAGSYGPVGTFTTTGCGFCNTGPYCGSRGQNANEEWIAGIGIGNWQANSLDDGGYADNSVYEVALKADSVYELRLTPGFSGSAFEEWWAVWLDLNGNGSFADPGEEVFVSPSPSTLPLASQIYLPPATTTSTIRMRVAMKFGGFGAQPPAPCDTFTFGEVEDYCLRLTVDSQACRAPQLPQTSVKGDSLKVKWINSFGVQQTVVSFRPVGTGTWLETTTASDSVFLTNLPVCTLMELRLGSNCANGPGNWSDTLTFKSPGCGNCQDLSYCSSRGRNTGREWLESVEFNQQVITTGNNNGYLAGTDSIFIWRRLEGINFTLNPGLTAITNASQFWAIRADWNQDGDFEDAGEWVWTGKTTGNNLAQGSFSVPQDAILGPSRLRVSMRRNLAPGSCDVFDFGEVEDYCLEIGDANAIWEDLRNDFQVFPNPSSGLITIRRRNDLPRKVGITVFDANGRKVFSQSPATLLKRRDIQLELPSGLYLMVLQGEKGQGRYLLQINSQ